MTPSQLQLSLNDIKEHLEHSNFRLNFYLKGGHVLRDYEFVNISQFYDYVVRAEKDDHPPAYLPIDQIVFVELT
jgi:hypothetical protein